MQITLWHVSVYLLFVYVPTSYFLLCSIVTLLTYTLFFISLRPPGQRCELCPEWSGKAGGLRKQVENV